VIDDQSRETARPVPETASSVQNRGACVTTSRAILPGNDAEVLADLKAKVSVTQLRAATAASPALIALYMEIGRRLAAQDSGWGTKVVQQLARDLKSALPEMAGFSRTNIFYMKQVYLAWKDADESVQQAVGLIP